MLDIKRSLQFSAAPVRTVVEGIRTEDYEVISCFINAIKISPYDNFSEIWISTFLEFNDTSHLFNKEESSLILSFGKNFGTSDMPEQLELIDMTTSYFDEYEKKAKVDFVSRGKLKLALPLYAGFIMCILII